MKACGGAEIELCSFLKSAQAVEVNFTPRQLYHGAKFLRYPLNRKLDSPRSDLYVSDKRKVKREENRREEKKRKRGEEERRRE